MTTNPLEDIKNRITHVEVMLDVILTIVSQLREQQVSLNYRPFDVAKAMEQNPPSEATAKAYRQALPGMLADMEDMISRSMAPSVRTPPTGE